MLHQCQICENKLSSVNRAVHTPEGMICISCIGEIQDSAYRKDLLESFDLPVLLMQSDPRQVVTANNRALGIFNKKLHQVEGHRGGEVFDCIHSYTEAGCGRDIHCEGCRIKDAIVDTFETGSSHAEIQTELTIRNSPFTQAIYEIQISSCRLGKLALVSIEGFELKS